MEPYNSFAVRGRAVDLGHLCRGVRELVLQRLVDTPEPRDLGRWDHPEVSPGTWVHSEVESERNRSEGRRSWEVHAEVVFEQVHAEASRDGRIYARPIGAAMQRQ